ncbi:MAG: tRNA (adenosine(37)-N6)-threonylcarbamoyltransferase complex dimerization subunit type 1 TsaB [Planctomycetes bacterium]|nr:tRNA (adenosine(37)-N6)-threonylcarbamoyltransferase complex dimerization subunit type 1 TsaB [Planctomycetota bacterium]
MRILALETSSTAGSVALLRGDLVAAEASLPTGQRSAQALAPAILETLATAGWRASDVAMIAVTQGPGSFTGLRIGAATAKTLAYALGADLIGVNTLEAIAAQAPPECGEVWTLLDAHRGQLFAARFRLGDNGPQAVRDTCVIDVDAWLDAYTSVDWIAGPGVSRVLRRLPSDAAIVDEPNWAPRAETVGKLAWRAHQQGRRDDVFAFAPRYYRPSAAEEA